MAELGQLLLAIAAILALGQIWTGSLVGRSPDHQLANQLMRRFALAQAAALLLAFGLLIALFVTSDFSVKLVTGNSHSMKPLIYKISGAWGNHEGSMLLWIVVMGLFGAALAYGHKALDAGLRGWTLAAQGLAGLGFLGFLIISSNPFDRQFPAPVEGRDLNPLLQDPGLALHPPMLYVGAVGLSAAWSLSVAGLLRGEVDRVWAAALRPWVLIAWSMLTGGIALGSWWAYNELGWGGFWFWDPVENASLLPWLIATALLHAVAVAEKRGAMLAWSVLLAIAGFALTMLGTFIVRSGLLTSVHAFTVDPERGLVILALITVLIGGSLALYAWRGPEIVSPISFAPVSREGAIVLNNLLLVAATATLLLGTLYPMIFEALGFGQMAVGAPFFNATVLPIIALGLPLMAIAPLMAWRKGRLAQARAAGWRAIAAAIILSGVLMLTLGPISLPGWLGLAFGAWLLAATAVSALREIRSRKLKGPLAMLRLPPRKQSMLLSHAGMALMVVAIAGHAVWNREAVAAVHPGKTVTFHNHNFTLEQVREFRGPNYISQQAVLSAPGVKTLTPERRIYIASGQLTTEASVDGTPLGDLYAVIGGEREDGSRTLRLYWRPLIPLLWIASTLMVLGGLIGLFASPLPALSRNKAG
ncbi:MAG: heme lyase CcmF/NrfE family subunit [Alphaproteobacteria bacterium]